MNKFQNKIILQIIQMKCFFRNQGKKKNQKKKFKRKQIRMLLFLVFRSNLENKLKKARIQLVSQKIKCVLTSKVILQFAQRKQVKILQCLQIHKLKEINKQSSVNLIKQINLILIIQYLQMNHQDKDQIAKFLIQINNKCYRISKKLLQMSQNLTDVNQLLRLNHQVVQEGEIDQIFKILKCLQSLLRTILFKLIQNQMKFQLVKGKINFQKIFFLKSQKLCMINR
ncbi:hypothetical protein TTHERM_000151708 (macronuclear) [Tetrahymena thermophila SB210]|uniref:Uncharacterized protein n=1 Tax=Tetrahymena thermophila (strain SB210) TaxID=312017 RepID=W7XG36_TETTS|nr:hypothetical protein TTHERM_000151708 [Tetrahymena thermophila SB210]EWS73051.1 hypothetical protein TTHERM_000151708 [Tetrahymena thermophila SB210]|eukprot:XP_012654448.1 hypothetical protein TTHERM_000151708 [Tetrahymena thermophila SB210]